ncbi:uncharacterized protein LOC102717661 isoform X2 [Oryza brachyantha]|uniref:uncharacterized protein LOC102717661 isoform X2 n=1 Tax=Oryza brachyantha TaxID=4533 RepID=UPI0007761479|nr:uncharacterized protein LOC102717661 isoform X2 [Oryza brachyantha]
MNTLVPAAITDIASRLASSAIKKYWQPPDAEVILETLSRLLLRVHIIIEEAEGKRLANEGMLLQLQMLIEGMYRGNYLLDRFKYPALQEDTKEEQVLSFLLQTDHLGDEDLAVLPIIGPRKCGKSTLVEHACRDHRVRNHYSSILFFRENNLKDVNMSNLREYAVVKHQNYSSSKRLLIIIELACDICEQTWVSLKSLMSCSAPGTKIIITSRSNEIESLGTTAALRLDLLHPEAYWYLFKTLAFGSRDTDEHPRLASIAMEIAAEYRGSFLAAYIIAGLLRDNFSALFWCSALKHLRAYVRSQLRLLGDHPNNLLRKDQSVHCLRFAEASYPLWMSNYYETDSCPDRAPNISDIMLGGDTPRGRFEVLGWKSRMAPYYSYMICCTTEAPGHAVCRKHS